jgi:hypothetical protein
MENDALWRQVFFLTQTEPRGHILLTEACKISGVLLTGQGAEFTRPFPTFAEVRRVAGRPVISSGRPRGAGRPFFGFRRNRPVSGAQE